MSQTINDLDTAFNCALRLVARTMKTESEVRKKLKEKGFQALVINRAIEKLKENNFINDENYVKFYVDFYKTLRGSVRIEYELLKKGVNLDLIREYTQEVDGVPYALKIAKTILKDQPYNKENKEKLFRLLSAKGFKHTVIYDVIAVLKNQSNNDVIDGDFSELCDND